MYIYFNQDKCCFVSVNDDYQKNNLVYKNYGK